MDTQRQGHLHWPIRTGEGFEYKCVLPHLGRMNWTCPGMKKVGVGRGNSMGKGLKNGSVYRALEIAQLLMILDSRMCEERPGRQLKSRNRISVRILCL